mmetsp:Transcript_994/g.3377  ORF Transcript_994/g.3377 Transcript_994/m.3377 type:complete len:231 (-) Transcript_994:559-1251(-)
MRALGRRRRRRLGDAGRHSGGSRGLEGGVVDELDVFRLIADALRLCEFDVGKDAPLGVSQGHEALAVDDGVVVFDFQGVLAAVDCAGIEDELLEGRGELGDEVVAEGPLLEDAHVDHSRGIVDEERLRRLVAETRVRRPQDRPRPSLLTPDQDPREAARRREAVRLEPPAHGRRPRPGIEPVGGAARRVEVPRGEDVHAESRRLALRHEERRPPRRGGRRRCCDRRRGGF